MDEEKPGARLKGETLKSWESFKIYRNMGETRSLSKVAKRFPEKPAKLRQLHRWSSKYNWVERCEDWDEQQDELLRKEMQAELKLMAKRHASIAMRLQKTGLDKIQEITTKELNPTDARLLIVDGMKFERLARGEPINIEETQTNVNFEDVFLNALSEIQKQKEIKKTDSGNVE